MTRLELGLLPGLHLSIHYFGDVRNGVEIKRKLAELDCAIVNADLIPNKMHLVLAVTKALYGSLAGQMRTRNLNTEIIYRLSPSTNVTESLQQYGAQESNERMLFLGVNKDENIFSEKIRCLVDGREISLDELPENCVNPVPDDLISMSAIKEI